MKVILSLLVLAQSALSLETHSPQYCGTTSYSTVHHVCCQGDILVNKPIDSSVDPCSFKQVIPSIPIDPSVNVIPLIPPQVTASNNGNPVGHKLVFRAANGQIADGAEEGDDEEGDDEDGVEGDDEDEAEGDDEDVDSSNDEDSDDSSSGSSDSGDDDNSNSSDDDSDDGSVSESGSSSSSSSSDSSSDENGSGIAGALFGEKSGASSGLNGSSDSEGTMSYYVQMTLINMWLIIGLIVFINVVFYCCYCRKQRNKYKKRVMSNNMFAEHSAVGLSDEEDNII